MANFYYFKHTHPICVYHNGKKLYKCVILSEIISLLTLVLDFLYSDAFKMSIISLVFCIVAALKYKADSNILAAFDWNIRLYAVVSPVLYYQ